MYVHHPSLVKLKTDLAQFIQNTLDAKPEAAKGAAK